MVLDTLLSVKVKHWKTCRIVSEITLAVLTLKQWEYVSAHWQRVHVWKLGRVRINAGRVRGSTSENNTALDELRQ